MTYGDVAAPMTHVMTELLRHGKPYYELGGKHRMRNIPAPGFEERAALVMRYRAMVLEYAEELGTALTAALTGDALVYRWVGWLKKSVPSRDSLPERRVASGNELYDQQANPVVELWRKAAVVSVIAREREVRPLLDAVNPEQRLVVLKDIGDLMRALFRLDDRYHRVPGWQHLAGAKGGRLDRNLEPGRDGHYGRSAVVRRFVEMVDEQLTPAGYTVDRLGYQPARAARTAGGEFADAVGALSRLAEVLDQESLRASSLRVLLCAHKAVSVQAFRLAGRAGDVSAQAQFAVRAKIFADLVAATRDVHGVVGDGVYAVSYSTVALDALTRVEAPGAGGVERLGEALDDVDARLADSIVSALGRGDYFVRHGEVTVAGPGGVRRLQAGFVPMTSTSSAGFTRLVQALRPGERPQSPASDAVSRRVEFGQMLGKSALETINGEHLERRARIRLEEQRERAGIAVVM